MPSPTLVAAAEATPPLRRRQHRPFESVTLHLPVFRLLVLPPRDWAALPSEILSCILHRLDLVQIMLGADKVCRSWGRAAQDEPELWRHIDMRGYNVLSYRNLVGLNQMAVEAVRRSQGQCQAFSGEGDGLHNEFIHYLGDHAPLLKRLILVWCGKLSGSRIHAGNKGIPSARGAPSFQVLVFATCRSV